MPNTSLPHPDLDDPRACPLGHRCESCGVERDDLTVSTAPPRWASCASPCARAAPLASAPPVSVSTAARLVGQHCVHLGIDLDQMAEALRADGERP